MTASRIVVALAAVCLLPLQAVGAEYAENLEGYGGLARAEFANLDNPTGEFGFNYFWHKTQTRSWSLYYSHHSSLLRTNDEPGVNAVGLMFRYQPANWRFSYALGLRNPVLDTDFAGDLGSVIHVAAVERLLYATGRYRFELYAGNIVGRETVAQVGIRLYFRLPE